MISLELTCIAFSIVIFDFLCYFNVSDGIGIAISVCFSQKIRFEGL